MGQVCTLRSNPSILLHSFLIFVSLRVTSRLKIKKSLKVFFVYATLSSYGEQRRVTFKRFRYGKI